MKIIGISGRMKSGKSTVAEYLAKENIGDIIGFSHPIKCLVSEYFSDMKIAPRSFDRQTTKEIEHKSGKTYRQVLQEVGAKMREVAPDIWIDNWKYAMKFTNCPTIVPDVRFPNEVKAIQEMGGIVIRLTRNPVDSDDETETALDLMESHSGLSYVPYCDPRKFNHVVNNADLSIDEANKICLKIAKEYLDETR